MDTKTPKMKSEFRSMVPLVKRLVWPPKEEDKDQITSDTKVKKNEIKSVTAKCFAKMGPAGQDLEDVTFPKDSEAVPEQLEVTFADSSCPELEKDSTIKIGFDSKGCLICKNRCGNNQKYINHLASHIESYDDSFNFCCIKCERRFDDKTCMITHLSSCLLPLKPTLSCFACGKVFHYNSILIAHERIHTGEKPFSCENCGKSFVEKSSLRTHVRIHLGIKPFKCSICGRSFTQSGELKTHMKINHSKDRLKFSCDECDKSFFSKSHLAYHKQLHSGSRCKSFECSDCGKCFFSKSTLNQHKQLHSKDKTFSCSQCKKQFSTNRGLNRHSLLHSGVKPFKCKECGLSFTRSDSLADHELKHSKIKQFTCSGCHKPFARKNHLRVHQSVAARCTVKPSISGTSDI